MFPSNVEIFASGALVAGALASTITFSRRVGMSVWPFVVVLVLCLGFGMARQIPEILGYLEQPDESFYLLWGRQLASLWATDAPVAIPYPIWPGSGVWSAFIGLATLSLGSVAFFPVAVNAVLLSLSFVILQYSTILFFRVKTAWISLVVFISNPAVWLNGPTLLREGSFWFGTSLMILSLGLIHRSKYVFGLLIAMVGSTVILAIRPNLGVFFVFMFLASATMMWMWKQRLGGGKYIGLGLGILSLLVVLFPLGVETLAGRDDLPEYAEVAARELSTIASTGFRDFTKIDLPSASICSGNEFVATACISLENLPYFLFGPFPWEFGEKLVWLYLVTSTWNFLFVLAFALLALALEPRSRPATLTLVIVASLLTLLLATSLTNYGIVSRFRTIVWLLLLPPAWAGMERAKRLVTSRTQR